MSKQIILDKLQGSRKAEFLHTSYHPLIATRHFRKRQLRVCNFLLDISIHSFSFCFLRAVSNWLTDATLYYFFEHAQDLSHAVFTFIIFFFRKCQEKIQKIFLMFGFLKKTYKFCKSSYLDSLVVEHCPWFITIFLWNIIKYIIKIWRLMIAIIFIRL